eukprot:SAG11_NODE_22441_length_406_cov_0.501629_1_plen_23_part_01
MACARVVPAFACCIVLTLLLLLV